MLVPTSWRQFTLATLKNVRTAYVPERTLTAANHRGFLLKRIYVEESLKLTVERMHQE